MAWLPLSPNGSERIILEFFSFCFFFNLLHLFIYVQLGLFECRSEDNLKELIFSFLYVDSRGRAKAWLQGRLPIEPSEFGPVRRLQTLMLV